MGGGVEAATSRAGAAGNESVVGEWPGNSSLLQTENATSTSTNTSANVSTFATMSRGRSLTGGSFTVGSSSAGPAAGLGSTSISGPDVGRDLSLAGSEVVDDADGEGGSMALKTSYEGLAAPGTPELTADIRRRALEAAKEAGGSGFTFRRKRRAAATDDAEPQPEKVAAGGERVGAASAKAAESSEASGGRGRRRLQTATPEERAILYRLHHWELTVEEKVSLVPDWQRRLLQGNEIGTPEALSIIQTRIAELYTDSACNATSGCDLTYGRCLNTTGGDVYMYDQNGTCVCHPWFDGGDCSNVITAGDACEYKAEPHSIHTLDFTS